MNHSFFVDRIEGDVAVLVTDDGDCVELPKAMLPAGVGEGRWVTLELAPDPAKDADATARVQAARAALTSGGDGDDGGDFAL